MKAELEAMKADMQGIASGGKTGGKVPELEAMGLTPLEKGGKSPFAAHFGGWSAEKGFWGTEKYGSFCDRVVFAGWRIF